MTTAPIYFTKNYFAEFSNFTPSEFTLNDKTWRTVEHYFQAMKFEGTENEEFIRNLQKPGQAKKWGRQLPLRSDWEDIKIEVMKKALHAKFTQNQPMLEVLLSTGDRKIVEESKFDSYWGCGPHRDGVNMLGKLIMELRSEVCNNITFNIHNLRLYS